MPQDSDTIARVLAGDTEAFRVLVDRYHRVVIRMVANLVGDRHGCEDVAQDVFLAAYRNLGSFDEERSSFSTWLFTITRNKSLNEARRRRPHPSDELPERAGVWGPDEAMAASEFHELLDKGLAALPEDQRAAFVLAEIEELSYQTIAQIEGVPVGTVRSRISRAKAKLRSLLGGLDAGAT